jgi:hypothetical protein
MPALEPFHQRLWCRQADECFGMKSLSRTGIGGPVSMFQDDGASTARTGIFVSRKAAITPGKGSRTSPEKLNPTTKFQLELELEDPYQTLLTKDGIHDVVALL